MYAYIFRMIRIYLNKCPLISNTYTLTCIYGCIQAHSITHMHAYTLTHTYALFNLSKD